VVSNIVRENVWSKQESCAIAQMTAQCALHMGALKIFGTAWLRPRPLVPTFSWAFVPIDSMNVPTKFEVRSFTRSWDNRGYIKNLGSPWIRPRSLFSKIFNGLLFWWALEIYLPNLKSEAVPFPEIIGGTQKFGQSLDMPTLHLVNFERAFTWIGPVNVPAKFEVRSFTCSWDKRGS